MELIDTSLFRYNVKIYDTNPFIKHIKDNNHRNLTRYHFNLHHHHHQLNNSHNNLSKHLSNKSVYLNNNNNNIIFENNFVDSNSSFQKLKEIKVYIKKRNFIISTVIVVALFMIIILFGFIFGLK